MDIKSEKYKCNGRVFYFRWNVRARIGFQKATGIIVKPDADPDDINLDEEQAFRMAYEGTLAGMRKEGIPFEMSFDDYLDFVDMDAEPIVKLFENMIPKEQPPDPGDKKKRSTINR